MTVIDLLKIQAKLASAEHLINQVNHHLAIKPEDKDMQEVRYLLSDAALSLRRQLQISSRQAIQI